MTDDAGALSRRALLVGGGAAAFLAAVGGGVAAEWDNPRFARLRGGCGDAPPVPASGYAVTRGTFRSKAMDTVLPWAVAIPNARTKSSRLALVLCLPGLGDDIETVFTGIGFPGWASQDGFDDVLAFAVPGGGGNLYWHPRADGRDPLAWALDEFVPMVEQRFDIGGSSARRATLGWSMGGFGALLAAQQRPEFVSAVAALSPAVFPSYDAARGGHSYTFDSAAEWERYGLWNELDEVHVPVRIDCGSYDPFAPTARELLKRIPDAIGSIGSGCHDKAFWRRTAPTSLDFLAKRLQASA